MENLPETFDRWRKNIMRVLSYILFFVLLYVFTDFFDEEVSDYNWSMILFLRTIITIFRIIALVVSCLCGEPLNALINFISVDRNFRYLNLACIGYLHSLYPTVLDYFAIIRSFYFEGMLWNNAALCMDPQANCWLSFDEKLGSIARLFWYASMELIVF